MDGRKSATAPCFHPGARARIAALGAALLAALLGTLPAEGRKAPDSVPAIRLWKDGPARYLMTSQEAEAMRGIHDLPALARFITEFWVRRDPTPGTFENEYRRQYWGRVLEANRRFRDSTFPGWKTDRGKIFILLGEPDDVETDEKPAVEPGLQRQARGPGAPSSGERGIERWTYKTRPSRRSGPDFIVAFVRDESLGWRLSGNPDHIEPRFPGLAVGDSSLAGLQKNPAESSPGASKAAPPPTRDPGAGGAQAVLQSFTQLDTSTLAGYDLGLELALPPGPELILGAVNAREFLSAFTASPAFQFFRAKDGSTFVNVGALVRGADLYGALRSGVSQLRVYASLAPRGDPSRTYYASNERSPVVVDLAASAVPGGTADLWTGLAVPPGPYRVTLAIEDSLTARLGRSDAEIEVPAFAGSDLSVSSLVIGTSVAELKGGLGVHTRAPAVFRKSEDFAVYFEVYGTGPEEVFDVTYRFFRETPGAAVPLGKPILLARRTGAAQGWSFPLKAWPAGRFRIETTVRDARGKTASAAIGFEVAE